MIVENKKEEEGSQDFEEDFDELFSSSEKDDECEIREKGIDRRSQGSLSEDANICFPRPVQAKNYPQVDMLQEGE